MKLHIIIMKSLVKLKNNPGCKVNSNIHVASLKLTKPIWCFQNSVENFLIVSIVLDGYKIQLRAFLIKFLNIYI